MPAPSTAPRIAGRLWLDFVNTDDEHHGRRTEHLRDFGAWARWLHEAGVLDLERTQGLERRAQEQPMGAQAALVDARRVRNALRTLAERGATQERARDAAVAEINRILERSSGTRRLEAGAHGFARTFRTGGDVFGGLLLAVVESAADALVAGEVARVKRCGAAGCARVYLDETRNHSRRWCTMADCGNRAKAARHRARQQARPAPRPAPTPPRSRPSSPASRRRGP
ncbi:MAG: ABATE domain-containing protein [Gemmatimonadetes bacterium]|nr:ABATE domain-containing protein [Gemmatimonadota bacterium]